MAKRSPIAGYNHNVRFRGLIFHVQTEDSGLASPHLFTHLFYGGVIISTRKLVYDAGSAEDAIKGLMQAQHKVVMKDLKRGAFDDKIDLYLAGNEELLPRAADSVGSDGAGKAASAAAKAAAQAVPEMMAADDTQAVPTMLVHAPAGRAQTDLDEIGLLAAMDAAVEAEAAAASAAPPPAEAVEAAEAAPLPVKPRTQTADRNSAPTKVRTSLPSEPPPPSPTLEELEPPTLTDSAAASVAAAVAASTATREDIARLELDDLAEVDAFDADDDNGDEEVIALEGGRVVAPASTAQSEPILMTQRRVTGSGAAVPPPPPPARPITRPPMTAPAGSREGTPGFVPDPVLDRAGQYAQHKRASQRMSAVDLARAERELSAPIPTVTPARPDSGPSSSSSQRMAAFREGSAPTANRTPTPSSPLASRAPTPSSPLASRAPTPSVPRSLTPSSPLASRAPTPAMPRSVTPAAAPPIRARAPEASARPVERPRTPTPARVSSGAAPARPSQGGSGGVVMSRPAVIVGAPPRQTTPPKIRKAREDEGRGFGQGLISEKSLDEVILAYLSEDAEDK